MCEKLAKKLKNIDLKRVGVRHKAKVELMKRAPERQSDHDKCVETVANKWKKEGYIVEADLPNWSKPSEISGYIPDIMARRDSLVRVCEVKTEETMEQHEIEFEFENNPRHRLWKKRLRVYPSMIDGVCLPRSRLSGHIQEMED